MPGEAKLVLGIIDKSLDFLPNFGQRRKKDYLKHRKIYLAEKAKPRHQRDDNKMWKAKSDYKTILEVYYSEVLK